MFKRLLQGSFLAAVIFSCTIESEISSPDEPEPFYFGEPQPLQNVWKEERFPHPSRPPADVLIAVDKSCSMSDNRAMWIRNMPDFVNVLEENFIDYHIGVITTDVINGYPGELSRYGNYQWVSPENEDPVTLFTALEASAWGPGEAGIEAVYIAIETERERGNYGFFRYGAPLTIVTISDEPDHSENITPRDLYGALYDYEWEMDSRVSYSVIVHLDDSEYCPTMSLSHLIGAGYIELANRWDNGLIIDICRPEWSQPVREIAREIGRSVSYFYPLSSVPVPESLTVQVFEDPATIVFVSEDDYIETMSDICRGPVNTEPCYKRTYYYDSTRNGIVFPEFIPEDYSEVVVGYYEASSYSEDNF